jgi:hypothetical protein
MKNAKAAQTRQMAHWMAQVYGEEVKAHPEDDRLKVRALMFASFAQLDSVCCSAGDGKCGRYPTKAEAQEIASLAEDALVCYNALRAEAVKAD